VGGVAGLGMVVIFPEIFGRYTSMCHMCHCLWVLVLDFVV
jgi:hypothetical protein